MKTFTYSIDSLLSKSIRVDLNKCKTIFDLKREIASDLHVDSKSISFPKEKNSELSKFEYNHEFIVSLNFRHKNLVFVFKFPDNYLEIYIEDCYKMTLEEVNNEFKKRQLFYSDTCIKHYIQFNNSGNEVPHIKYPFIAITSDRYIQVKINCEYVILNYGYKKFIFSDTELVYDAVCLIRKIYSNCTSILIQDKDRNKINEHEKFNKNKKYNIVVLFTVKFQEIGNSKSSFSQEIDFLTNVDEVKLIIAKKYGKYKYSIRLYNEDYKQITDPYKTLKSYQYLDKIFYFDTGSNNQVKFSPKTDEYKFKSNENNNNGLNSQFKYKIKEHDLNINSKFTSKNNFIFDDDDDDDTLDSTEDESNFESQSTDQSSINESGDFDSSHQNKPNILSNQKLSHYLKDDKYQSKQIIKSEKKIWSKNQNQSYMRDDLNKSNDALPKDDGIFNKFSPKKESKHEPALYVNYTDSDDYSSQSNKLIGSEYHFTKQNIINDNLNKSPFGKFSQKNDSKNEPANKIHYTDSDDYSYQTDQQTESDYHHANHSIINDGLNKSTSFKNIYPNPKSNYEQTNEFNYTDSNDDSYQSNQPIKSKFHLTNQSIINDDLKKNKNTFNKISPEPESKKEITTHINYTDSDDYSYQSDQPIKTEYCLTSQSIINDDLKEYKNSFCKLNSNIKSNHEPAAHINYTDSDDYSNQNEQSDKPIGLEYHFTKQDIINDDLKEYKNSFNKFNSNLKSKNEPSAHINCTDSNDNSYQRDKPIGSKYHLTNQNVINDDLKEYNNQFNKINSNLKSNQDPSNDVNYTDSDDHSNRNDQSDKPIGFEYHFTKQDIINDDLKKYKNAFSKINLKSNHEQSNIVNRTDSDDYSNQSDKPIGSEYHFTKQEIINDDLEKYKNSFSKINSKPEPFHEQESNINYTDSYDYSYQSDQPVESEHHFTKQNIINDDSIKHNNSFSKTSSNPESKHEQTSNTNYTDSYYYSYQSNKPIGSEYHFTKQSIINDDSTKHNNSFSKTSSNPESKHEQTSNTNYTDSYYYSYQSEKPAEHHFTKQEIINEDSTRHNNSFSKMNPKPELNHEQESKFNYTNSYGNSYQRNKPIGSEYHFTKQNIINDDLKEYKNTFNKISSNIKSKNEPSTHINYTDSYDYSYQSDKPIGLESHFTKQSITDENSRDGKLFNNNKNYKLKPESKSQSHIISSKYQFNNSNSNNFDITDSENYFSDENKNAYNLKDHDSNKPKNPDLDRKQKPLSDDIFVSNDYNDIEVSDEIEVNHCSPIFEEEEENDNLYKEEEHHPKSYNILPSSSNIEHHEKENDINDSIIEEEEAEDDGHQNDEHNLKSYNILSPPDCEFHENTNMNNNISIIEEEEAEDDDLNLNDGHDLKLYNILSPPDCEFYDNANMNSNISFIEEEEEFEDDDDHQNDGHDLKSYNILSSSDCEFHENTNINNNIKNLHRESDLSSHNLLSFSSDDGNKNNNNDKF